MRIFRLTLAGTAMTAGMVFGVAAPALAASSVSVSPAIVKTGDQVTITTTCDEGFFSKEVNGGGAFPNQPNINQDKVLQVTVTAGPGTYIISGTCLKPPQDEEHPVATLVVVAPSSTPTPTPSGPAKTGAGGAMDTGHPVAGAVAIGSAILLGAGLVIARRRRT